MVCALFGSPRTGIWGHWDRRHHHRGRNGQFWIGIFDVGGRRCDLHIRPLRGRTFARLKFYVLAATATAPTILAEAGSTYGESSVKTLIAWIFGSGFFVSKIGITTISIPARMWQKGEYEVIRARVIVAISLAEQGWQNVALRCGRGGFGS